MYIPGAQLDDLIHVCCKMTTTKGLTHPLPHTVTCECAVGTFKVDSLSYFQVYNAVVSTAVAAVFETPALTHNCKCGPLDPHLPSPPQPLAKTILLSGSMSSFFFRFNI